MVSEDDIAYLSLKFLNEYQDLIYGKPHLYHIKNIENNFVYFKYVINSDEIYDSLYSFSLGELKYYHDNIPISELHKFEDLLKYEKMIQIRSKLSILK